MYRGLPMGRKLTEEEKMWRRKERQYPVAVFQLVARTYMPWKLFEDFVARPWAGLGKEELSLLEAKQPTGWSGSLPSANPESISEWMLENDLKIVDIKAKKYYGPGAWQGKYVVKIGRAGEWPLTPWEMALEDRPEPLGDIPF